MGYENDRILACLPDAQELTLHVCPGQFIQGAERFIHEQDLRIHSQGASDSDALLHATGELSWILVLKAPQTNQVNQLLRQGPPLGLWHPTILWPKLNIADGGQPGEKGWVLENHAAIRPWPLNPPAINPYLAAGWPQEASDKVKQRSLATPAPVNNRDELVRLDDQANLGESEAMLRILG